MIMSYAAHRKEFGSLVSHRTSPTEEGAARKAGFLRRIFNTIMVSRQREADRQIARFLAARSGGVLTDNLEREMMQRLSTSNWSLNANPYDDRRFP
jgi:hypothetical protein